MASTVADFNQTDSLIERDRFLRLLVALVSPVVALLLGYILGDIFARLFKLPLLLGHCLGLGLGAWVAVWLISKSYIVNGVVTAFVTIDPLVSLFNKGSALVFYGPGFHFCFWWEQRSGGNTIDLSEAAESFSIVVQGPEGSFTIKYSVRLRPDICHLGQFLSGVASVAADLEGIISKEIIDFMKDKSVAEALGSLAALNERLEEKFKARISPFESRFGVKVGDITAQEILPSKEVQETLSAVTESALIDQIVAKSFGYDSAKDLREAVTANVVQADEVTRRRTQTLALSGNLQGMDLKDHNFTFQVKGLEKVDPEVIKALANAGPMGAMVAAKLGGTKPKGGS